MAGSNPKTYIAFEGVHRLAHGPLPDVAMAVKRAVDHGSQEVILVFDSLTSAQVDLDLRGSEASLLERFRGQNAINDSVGEPEGSEPSPRAGPGRPRLGVVSREVTLLPRHWEWLNAQPGGASAALRRLVEEARRVNDKRDRIRFAQEAAYKFMSAMAGNEPGFEEATRALYRLEPERFMELTDAWPADIRDHVRGLAGVAFETRALEKNGAC